MTHLFSVVRRNDQLQTSFCKVIFSLLLSCIGVLAFSQSNHSLILYNKNEMLLENARVVDVITGTVLEQQAIYISNGKIKAIATRKKIKVPKGISTLDLQGKTVLPGLVMLHEHMNYNNGAGVWLFQPASFPKLYLAAGVTTLRTAGAENPMYDLNLKRRIDKGLAIGPRMFVTGPMFNDPSGGFLGDFVITTYEEARKATAFWAEQGCTSFKVYSDISRNALMGVIDEAHARGLIVTGHLGKMSCSEATELGIDNIEHGFASCVSDLNLAWDSIWHIDNQQKKVTDLINRLVARNVVLTVTPFSDSDFGNVSLFDYLSTDERKRIEGYVKERPPFIPKEQNEVQLRPLEKTFVTKGGHIVLGADAADFGILPGFQDHNAMVSMVKGGWKPMDVIRMATIDGARFLKAEGELGSIEVGKSADLIIVSGKPDQTMEDIRNVDIVFEKGVGYDSKALRERAKGLVGRH
ncbi:amidohydrolase family protein [Chryseolinea sp. T2]|uniref:amidohydrolase family protein n=1 Tax=Chryseolinea sp. T2 TaxID=3129255 RepID=UPI003077BDCF